MDLVKAFRAMQSTPEWSESVQAACLFANKEFTPEIFQEMTREFLDDLVYDRETFVVFVPVSIGGPLMEAVANWQPPIVEAPPELPALPGEPGALPGEPEELPGEPGALPGEPEEEDDILVEEEIIEGEPDA